MSWPEIVERERMKFEFELGLPLAEPVAPARDTPKHG